MAEADGARTLLSSRNAEVGTLPSTAAACRPTACDFAEAVERYADRPVPPVSCPAPRSTASASQPSRLTRADNVEAVSARRTERLLNLVFCLLSTRRFLTADEIRDMVEGYRQEGDEAFQRMFERDKEELREIGVPLETGSGTYDDTPGYRIARGAYELPDIRLDPDEAAAVGLATRQWKSAQLAAAAGRARLKLAAIGADLDPSAFEGLEPHVEADPALPALVTAASARQAVQFAYRRTDQSEPEQRTIEPWRVLSWHGHWYVVGRARDRQAARIFRLSRIVSEVTAVGDIGSFEPPRHEDVDAQVRSLTGDVGTFTAQVKVRAGKGFDIRRLATHVQPTSDGWEQLTVQFSDPEWLADQIAGYGADAVVIDPPEAREAVIRRLQAVVEAVL